MGAPSRGSCTQKIPRTLANGELTMYGIVFGDLISPIYCLHCGSRTRRLQKENRHVLSRDRRQHSHPL